MNTNVKAWWLGHSAFKLESPAGKIIYIDPFLSQNPSTPDTFKIPDEADYILLTHGHEDHVGDTIDIANRTGSTVVSQVELSQLLINHGLNKELATEFNKGGSIEYDDFTVTLVSARHSSSFAGEYAGEAGGVILSFNDDIVFYHLGDTNIFADLELYGELYEPDIIAVPMGDYYTMGPKEAALCCELINAEVAIPIHYGTFPVLTGDPEEFKNYTEEYSETKVLIPQPGDQFLPGD
jgi:L-ascorbate metabolism protein UlaG (beta-lactamase superfamily)